MFGIGKPPLACVHTLEAVACLREPLVVLQIVVEELLYFVVVLDRFGDALLCLALVDGDEGGVFNFRHSKAVFSYNFGFKSLGQGLALEVRHSSFALLSFSKP